MEKQVIEPARKKGVYVILHAFMENSENDLPDQKAIEMWGEVAKHYQNDPLIIYDPIPEPHNITKQQLRDIYQKVIETIRAEHTRSLIMVTGLGWGREINSYLEDPLPYENIVYRSNPYNRKGEFEGLFGEIAKEYPVFLTEFGADDYPPMSPESVQALLDYANELGLGWTAWHFHSVGCPCLLKDWKTFVPTEWGELVYQELQKQPQVVELSETEQENPNEIVIYSDAFKNGFVEQGWEIDVELQSKEKKYQGENSIKLTYKNPYSGLGLHTFNLIDPSKFRFLEFYVNFVNQESYELMVSIDDANNELIGEVSSADYQQELGSGWFQVRLPLEEFGVGKKLISGIAIKESLGRPKEELFIDEIKIIR
jgi:hypothetical protein